jgi:hypothetical protein
VFISYKDLDDAVESLARRAVTTRRLAGMAKRADLSEMAHRAWETPEVRNALIGGGVGGALGLGSSLMSGGDEHDRPHRHLYGALTGAAAGAAIGGGGTLAYRNSTFGKEAPKEPTGPVRRPGEFTDSATGKAMKWDAEALRQHPGLADKIQAAQRGAASYSPAGMGMGGAALGAAQLQNHPLLGAAAGVGLLDRYATRAPAGSFLSRNVDPSKATNPEYLRHGLGLVGKKEAPFGLNDENLKSMRALLEAPDSQASLAEIAARRQMLPGVINAAENETMLGHLMRTGLDDYTKQHYGAEAKPLLRKTLFGRQYDPRAAGAFTLGNLGRGLGYGALVGGDILLNDYRHRQQSGRELSDMIRQYAKEVPQGQGR